MTEDKVHHIDKSLKFVKIASSVGPLLVILAMGIGIGTFKANDVHQNVDIAGVKGHQRELDQKMDHIIGLLDTLNVEFREQVVWSRQQVLIRDAHFAEVDRRIAATELKLDKERERIDQINNRWRYTP